MREILYRGKRVDNGEWVEGIYTPCGWDIFGERTPEPNIMIISENGKEDGLLVEIIPETVGQYTGLTVANGKVFDGDIIRFGSNLYLVFWNEEAFQWQAKRIDTNLEIHRTCGGCHDFDWTITDLGCIAAEPIITRKTTTEIIGNIHDNPELIGGTP